MLLRPDDIVGQDDSPLKASIVGKTFLGATTMYRLQLPTGSILEAIFPSHDDHPLGENVGIRIAADHLVVFTAQGSVNVHAQLPLEQMLDAAKPDADER
nr:TOBE domain-containing protein [Halopseudomonas salina]